MLWTGAQELCNVCSNEHEMGGIVTVVLTAPFEERIE